MAQRSKKQSHTVVFFGIFFIIVVLTVFFVSQRRSLTDQRGRASGGVSFDTLCAMSGTTMTSWEAFTIAQSSVCTAHGYITSAPRCNVTSDGGWQMDLSIKPSADKNYLCHPVCIISPSTRTARIDYRCTDTKPPDSASCKRTGCNGEVCVNADAPSLSSACVIRPEHSCIQNLAACTLKSDGQCGFSPVGMYSDCMNERGCGWCGSTCTKAGVSGCSGTPPANTVCVLENNTCIARTALCSWCDGTCLRRLPTEGVCAGALPPGLLCTEVSGTNACSVKIDPAYTPTPTPTVTSAPTATQKPTATVTPVSGSTVATATVTPTSTVTPTNTPASTAIPGMCDASCQGEGDCADWLNCYTVESSVKRCRKPECPGDNTCCRYPSVTATYTPTPTSGAKQSSVSLVTTTPSVTPTETPLFTITPTEGVKTEDTALRVTSLEGSQQEMPDMFPVAGTAAPNATVVVSIDPDGIKETVSADADGAWSISLPKKMMPGMKTLVAVSTDLSGQEQTMQYTFTVKGGSQFPWTSVVIGGIVAACGILAVILFRKKIFSS